VLGGCGGAREEAPINNLYHAVVLHGMKISHPDVSRFAPKKISDL
jgi:hypothetical protein